MAKKDKHVMHRKSNVSTPKVINVTPEKQITINNPKAPFPENINYGEIAINYGEGSESLFIKNSNNKIVKLNSLEHITFDGKVNESVEAYINSKLNGGGQVSNLTIKKLSAEELLELADSNIKEAFKLTDLGNSEAKGEIIKIYKDSSLKSVELVEQSLVFTYILSNGQESIVPIDISNFLSENEFKDGLNVENHVVSVKKDQTSEKYLDITSSGVKVSGIDDAIKNAVESKVFVVNNVTASTLGNKTEVTIDGSDVKLSAEYTPTEYPTISETVVFNPVVAESTVDESVKQLDDNISKLVQEVLDNEKVASKALTTLNDSCGFNENGKYITNPLSNYINDAINLQDADLKLDEAIKTVNTKLETLTNDFKIVKVTDGLGENIKEAYKLVGKDGQTALGEQINVYKDRSLVSVELVSEKPNGESEPIKGQFLKFVYNTESGKQDIVYVDMSLLVTKTQYGNGLTVSEASQVSVLKDPSSEKYLEVAESGVSIKGIDAALALKTDLSEHIRVKDLVQENLKIKADKKDVEAALALKADQENLNALNTLVGKVSNTLKTQIEDETKAREESVKDMATQTWVNQQGFLTSHQDISGKLDKSTYEADKLTFALKSELPDVSDMETQTHASQTYQKKGDYALKSDLTPLATKEEVKLKQDKLVGTEIEGQNIKTVNGVSILGQGNIEIKTTDGKTKVESVNGKTGVVTLLAKDLSAPTVEEMNTAITEKVPTKTSQLSNDSNFLTEHQDISGKLDVIAYTEDKKTFATQKWVGEQGFLTSHQNIDGKLDASIYNKDKPTFALKTDLEPLATKDEIANMATQTWVNQQGFLTSHQNIDGKLDKSTYEADKPTFAVKTEVNKALDLKASKEEIADMETKTHASQTYQNKGDYALNSALTPLATKEEVNLKQDKLSAGEGISIDGNTIKVTYKYDLFEIVETLPLEHINDNKIYLKLSESTGINNKYTEYVHYNGEWEIIGEYTADVNLEGYAKESWVKQQGFANEATVNESLALKADKSEIANMATQTWVNQQGFLTSHQNIDGKLDASVYNKDKPTFALKTELTPLATKAEVKESLDLKADKSEISGKLDVTAYTEDKKTFALKSELPDVSDMETQTHASQTYQKKGDYALNSALIPLATKEEVKSAKSIVEIDRSDDMTLSHIDVVETSEEPDKNSKFTLKLKDIAPLTAIDAMVLAQQGNEDGSMFINRINQNKGIVLAESMAFANNVKTGGNVAPTSNAVNSEIVKLENKIAELESRIKEVSDRLVLVTLDEYTQMKQEGKLKPNTLYVIK